MHEELTPEEVAKLRETLSHLSTDRLQKLGALADVITNDPKRLDQIVTGLGKISDASEGLRLLSEHSEALLTIVHDELRNRENAETLRRRARDFIAVGGVAGAVLALLMLWERAGGYSGSP
jgi:hypothetical protein